MPEDDDESCNINSNQHCSGYSSGRSRGVYVNLLQNPERFTGYAGPSAHRVWQAMIEENCFGGINDVCLEKRVFHRSALDFIYQMSKFSINSRFS